MKNTWKKRTALGVMVFGLLAGGTYTATEFSQSQPGIGEEISAASATKFSTTSYKTKDNLNMRTGASTKHKRLLTIPKGATVSSNYRVGNWYKVSYKGKTGYVSGSYISKVIAPKATAKTTSASKQYQTKDNLNMRTGASTKYKRITTIPKGKKVTYLGKSGSWYKVQYGSKKGYVSSSYLKGVSASKPAPKAKPAPKPAPKAPAVSTGGSYKTKDNLNMRTGASTKYKRITTIPKGKTVSYVGKKGSWYKVKFGSKTGYVSSAYLTKVSTAKPAPKPAPKKEVVTSTSYKTKSDLNMRTGASVNNKKVTVIPKGKSVKYISKKGSWYKVQYGSKSGYVSSKYLTKVSTTKPAPKPVAKPKPTPKPVPKAPTVSQKIMSRSQANNHVGKYMTNTKSNVYTLFSPTGNDSVTVGFASNSSNKGNLGLDIVDYISAYEVKPSDFGQDNYNQAKAFLKKLDGSILAFAETQFGSGTSESKRLASEIQKLAIKGEKGDSKALTLQGKKVTVKHIGSDIIANY